jgi:hypothetical protein
MITKVLGQAEGHEPGERNVVFQVAEQLFIIPCLRQHSAWVRPGNPTEWYMFANPATPKAVVELGPLCPVDDVTRQVIERVGWMAVSPLTARSEGEVIMYLSEEDVP